MTGAPRSDIESIIKKVDEYVRANLAEDLHHDYWHARRVEAYAIRIARKEGANENIVRLSALLHDIGKRAEMKEGRSHTIIGSEIARSVLSEFGTDEKMIEQVIECIESHSRISSRKTPKSLEAKVIYDADGLDMVGAVGLLRTALSAIVRGAGWDHIIAKIKWRCELLSDFKTAAGRKISAERSKLVRSFAQQLFEELRLGGLTI